MVSLEAVRASNALLPTTLPNLVAVFVGATSGIGEYSLKAFARRTLQPRAYFIGRSQEAGSRIKAECEALNPQGEFIFISADTSLLVNVDKLCDEIKQKEKYINILFLTTGTFAQTETSEGLLTALSLAHYSRLRFTLLLLPLLQRAPLLRRVISVFCGTKEGPLLRDDLDYRQGPKFPPLAARGHCASLVTLGLAGLAKQAPDVGFVHGFPGAVKSNIARDLKGIPFLIIGGVYGVFGRWLYVKEEEVGERHLFLMTSAMYAGRDKVADGVGVGEEGEVARGVYGCMGSGVYSIQQNNESANPEVEVLLKGYRDDGLVEKVWTHTERQFKRILG